MTVVFHDNGSFNFNIFSDGSGELLTLKPLALSRRNIDKAALIGERSDTGEMWILHLDIISVGYACAL